VLIGRLQARLQTGTNLSARVKGCEGKCNSYKYGTVEQLLVHRVLEVRDRPDFDGIRSVSLLADLKVQTTKSTP